MKHWRLVSSILGLGLILVLAGCASGPDPDRAGARYAPLSEVRRSDGGARFDLRQGESIKLDAKSGLEDYLAYAAINNPGLEAAFYRWRAALERGPQARSLPDPMIRYSHFIRSVETRVGAQRGKLGVSQTVPWPGKLVLAGQVADQAALAARKRYEHVKLAVFFKVKNAYYEYWYLGRSIEITAANVQLVENLEGVARTRYKAAAAGHPDVIRAQMELGKLEDRLKSLKELRGPILARLNAVLNRPSSAALPMPAQKPSAARLSEADQQAIAGLRKNNPELAALSFEVQRARKSVSLARQSYLPNFTFGLDYVFTDKPDGPMPGDDRGKDPLAISVGISLPLWFGKNRAAVREARARLRSAQLTRQDRENNLSARLKRVLFGVRDAERKIELYGEILTPKAEQALKATETAFRTGKVDFLDLISAQRILLEFQLSRQRALSRHAQRLAELEMLIGRKVQLTTLRRRKTGASSKSSEQKGEQR
jgi:outer membrane protein, heavy metal efflux system